MITYLIGDATAPKERPAVITHVCNDMGLWGAGFVLTVSRRWERPEEVYRREHLSGGLTLGALQLVAVGENLWVANLIGQHGIRQAGAKAPIRYRAIRTALTTLGAEARQLRASVHMPRIGCGLAGGRWELIEPIIEETLAGLSVTVYDLPRLLPDPGRTA